MRLDPPFHVWPDHFPADFCEKIVNFGDSLEAMSGNVSYDPGGKARASRVAWIQDTPGNAWIIQPIADLVAVTNRRYWKWAMSGRESFQYTRYGPDQFYDWHMDTRTKPYEKDERWGGLMRKISVTVTLSPATDFAGGDFQIEETTATPDRPQRRVKTLEIVRGQGSVVIFPSHLHHRVQPITSGIRRSLVAWFLGPPFV